jgi:SAM-dependent methyltransferase
MAQHVGCRVHGVDINPQGVARANEAARSNGLDSRVTFSEANADKPLPYADETFDALLCIDAVHHFPERLQVLKDWRRVLKPQGKVLVTDPVVVTGLVSNEELAQRSSIGIFVFAPPGVYEHLIQEAGFALLEREDVTESAAIVSKRWHDARAEDRAALIQIEGQERFEGLQQFFAMVHRVSSERRLSRFAYLLQKERA